MHIFIPLLLFNLPVSHSCSSHRPVFDSIIRQWDYIINHAAVKANPQLQRTNIDVPCEYLYGSESLSSLTAQVRFGPVLLQCTLP